MYFLYLTLSLLVLYIFLKHTKKSVTIKVISKTLSLLISQNEILSISRIIGSKHLSMKKVIMSENHVLVGTDVYFVMCIGILV